MEPNTAPVPAPIASEEQPRDEPWSSLPALVETAKAGGWLIETHEVEMDKSSTRGGVGGDNEVGKALGEGSSGKIKLARWRGTLVAAKRVRVDSNSRATSFFREVKALAKIRHPHVLPFYGASLSPPDECVVVTQVCRGGTVKDWLYPKGDPDSLPPVVRAIRGTGCPALQHRLSVARQIAGALSHLEASGLAHRDLKPGNVFILDKVGKVSQNIPNRESSPETDENDPEPAPEVYGTYADAPHVVVADFGLTRDLSDIEDANQLKSDETNETNENNFPKNWTGETGTYLYMAPEVVRANGCERRYGLSADVWSFGVLLHELVQGVPPYRKERKELLMTAAQIALGVENGAVTLESFGEDENVSLAGVLAITKKCTERDPNHRPSFREICDALDAMIPAVLRELEAKANARKSKTPLENFIAKSFSFLRTETVVESDEKNAPEETNRTSQPEPSTVSLDQFLEEKKTDAGDADDKGGEGEK